MEDKALDNRETHARTTEAALGVNDSNRMAPKLGEGLAESGAQFGRAYEIGDGKMGVSFIRPDGKEVDLTGVPAFIAGIIGGFFGWRRKK